MIIELLILSCGSSRFCQFPIISGFLTGVKLEGRIGWRADEFAKMGSSGQRFDADLTKDTICSAGIAAFGRRSDAATPAGSKFLFF